MLRPVFIWEVAGGERRHGMSQEIEAASRFSVAWWSSQSRALLEAEK